MTLIGVAGMQTTVLEEKMAGNLNNANIAFQAADSCASRAMADPDRFTIDIQPVTGYSGEPIGASIAPGHYSSTHAFRMYTIPPRNYGYSALSFRAAHNEARCTGTGPANARAGVVQGIFQIIPQS